jgi:AsmA protein
MHNRAAGRAGRVAAEPVWVGLRRPKVVAVALGLSAWIAGLCASIFLDGSARAENGLSIEIRHPTVLSLVPPVILLKGHLRGDNALHLGALAARVVGKGTRHGKLVLQNAELSVDFAAPAGSVRPTSTVTSVLASLVSGSFEQIDVKSATIRLLGAGGRTETLHKVDLVATVHGSRKTALRGSFRWRGREFTLEGTLEGGRTGGGLAGMPRFLVTLSEPLLKATIEGHLLPPAGRGIVGTLDLQIADLRAWARQFALPIEKDSRSGPFTAKGRLNWQGGVIAVEDARFDIDGSGASGALSLAYGGERPQIEGTLAFTQLDLVRALALGPAERKKPTKGEKAAAGPAKRAPAGPASIEGPVGLAATTTSFPLLRHIDADLRVSADAARIGALDMAKAAATFTVRRARLMADIAEVELDGGLASGQVTIDMSGEEPRYSLRIKANGLDATRSMAQLVGSGWLTGRADIALDVSGIGETVGELLHDLSGRARLTLPDGARLGADMRALLNPVASGGKPAAVSAYKGSTRLSGGELEMFVWRGTAFISEGEVRTSDRLRLKLEGSAGLAQRAIDLELTPLAAPTAPGAAEPARRSAVERTVRVRGPWHNPDVVEANASMLR